MQEQNTEMNYLISKVEGMKSENKEFYAAIYNLVKAQNQQLELLNQQIGELKSVLVMKASSPQQPNPTGQNPEMFNDPMKTI